MAPAGTPRSAFPTEQRAASAERSNPANVFPPFAVRPEIPLESQCGEICGLDGGEDKQMSGLFLRFYLLLSTVQGDSGRYIPMTMNLSTLDLACSSS